MTEHEQTPYVIPDISLVGDDHVRRYQETDGEVGYLWNGATCCILTTKGRKTGQARQSALICGFDSDDVIVVGSKGGAPAHPLWYLNLSADPNVEVQVGTKKLKAHARTVSGEERARLWEKALEFWPPYADYQKKDGA